jgi:hypothetical protein
MSAMNACNASEGKKCCPCVGIGMAAGLLLLLAGIGFTLYIATGPYRHLASSSATPLPSDVAKSISDAIIYAWWGAGLSLGGTLLVAVSWLMRWREKKRLL